ncbi:hypothetical protein EJK15_58200 [Nonomuraea basaltis]|nr:hypothetical protein EJK15_58200 [Nonomuraea basaltis]
MKEIPNGNTADLRRSAALWLRSRFAYGVDHERRQTGVRVRRGRSAAIDAEVIRTTLRKTGRREFSERHDGFVVDGGENGAPFLIAYTDDDAEVSAQELTRSQVDLGQAGYRVEPDPDDDQVLLVRDGS